MIKEQILNKIQEYQTIIIHGHCRPDGDCYGSQIGLKEIIKSTYPSKNVYVVGEKAEYLSFLGQMDIIDDSVYDNALAIVCDVPIESRISDLRYKLAKEVIKIDHHLEIERFGILSWVMDNCPACCQMIASLLIEHKELKISKEGAIALYVGIVTDTGRFKYRGVDSSTLTIAGHLLNYGIDVSVVDSMLSVETLNTIKLKGYVLSNFIITENGFVYAVVDRKTIKKFEVSDEEAASMVNQIANIKDCPVWALIIEYENQIRIRLRSRGPRVDLLANKYNGGGHQLASGAGIDDFSKLGAFVKDADELIFEYKRVIK